VFPLPYKQPFNWILYVLFVLEIALLAGGLFFGRLNEERTCRLPRPLRMLLSAMLVVAAFLGWQGGAPVFGMVAFGIGHLLYVAALLHLTLRSGFTAARVLVVTLVVMLGFCSWAWYTQVRKPGGSKVINAGSLVYGWLIGLTAALAIALAVYDTHYVTLAAGALLFLASDFVLGNWVIRGHVWKSVNDVIWVTYVSGQLLIIYSVAAALNALH